METFRCALAVLVLAGVVSGGGTVDEPEKPAWFPADGSCSACCNTTVPLKYIKKVVYVSKVSLDLMKMSSGTPVKYSADYATKKTVEWFPQARCISKTTWDTRPCHCRFENLQCVRYTFERRVTTAEKHASITSKASGQVPLPVDGLPPVEIPSGRRDVLIAIEADVGPWVLTGTNYFSRDCCMCLNAQNPDPPVERYPRPEIIPSPTGQLAETATEGDVPVSLYAPNEAWPTRCTNPMCVSSGSVVYSSVAEGTESSETVDVFAGSWNLDSPVMKPLTKRYLSSVKVTWTVSGDAKCSTRNDHRPNCADPLSHSQPCQPCELESVPKGTAEVVTGRQLQATHLITETISTTYKVPGPGSVEITVTMEGVAVDFTLVLSAWSEPSPKPAVFAESENKCGCCATPATGYTPVDPEEPPREGYPQPDAPIPESQADPERDDNDGRERRTGGSQPIPRTGG